MVNLYHILQIEAGSDDNAVKKAFRQLAKKYHPDVNNSASANEKFNEIYMAYEILSDADKKLIYDRMLNGNAEPEITVESYQEEHVNFWQKTAYDEAKSYSGMSYKDFRRHKILLHQWSKNIVVEVLITLFFIMLLFFSIMVIENSLPYSGSKGELINKERQLGFGILMAIVSVIVLISFIKIQINNFVIRKE